MSSSTRVLENKVAIVTGGSRGIGAAICHNLASKGCSLVINYTSERSAPITESLVKELTSKHSIDCVSVQADMGSESGPAHIVHKASQHFAQARTGRPFQIDIVINNAGVGGKTNIEDVSASEFDKLYNINVRGPLLLIKSSVPYLPRDRSGRLVNLSSVSSSCGFDGDSIYGGTKAALEAMTRTWARELAERATVNAVNPGPVATDMYWANPPEFLSSMSHWTKNTPLAKVRSEVDTREILDGAELAGGRPVRNFPSLCSHRSIAAAQGDCV